jgi:hypothetical protein
MRALTGVVGLLVVVAVVTLLARGGLRGTAHRAAAASAPVAPADLTRGDGHKQLKQDLERGLQDGADKALQSGY